MFSDVSNHEFRKSAKEFFDNSRLPQFGFDECENGFKALSIMYINRSADWCERLEHEARIILEMAGKRLFEKEFNCGN